MNEDARYVTKEEFEVYKEKMEAKFEKNSIQTNQILVDLTCIKKDVVNINAAQDKLQKSVDKMIDKGRNNVNTVIISLTCTGLGGLVTYILTQILK